MGIGPGKNHYMNYPVRLEVGKIKVYFTDVSGLNDPGVSTGQAIDIGHHRKQPGAAKPGTIILKQGITDCADIYDWYKAAVNGHTICKDIIITLQDQADQVRWYISNAWPSKYEGPDFNAKGNDVAIENLELVHEGITRAD